MFPTLQLIVLLYNNVNCKKKFTRKLNNTNKTVKCKKKFSRSFTLSISVDRDLCDVSLTSERRPVKAFKDPEMLIVKTATAKIGTIKKKNLLL